MSFTIINGRQVETLDCEWSRENYNNHPDFFEPKPVSPKNKKTVLFSGNQDNIKFHFHEEVKFVIKSILGKRKLCDAFGFEYSGDEERYGQIISDNFFNTNVGHNVVQ
jgi:hypothetical protein